MKKVFEEAKIEKISVSVIDIVTSSGNDGSFNIGNSDNSQGWDDISSDQ